MRAGQPLVALDHHGGADIAKDEMAVAVAPFEVGRTNLGVDHEGATQSAGLDHLHSGLDAEGGRRAGHVHIIGEAARADE